MSAPLRQQLLLLPYRFVFLGDDDKAGLAFSKTFGLGAVSGDLDELPENELMSLLKSFNNK